MAKLNESLVEVNNIVKHSMQDLISRGENIDDVGRRAQDLREASRRFAKQAQTINFHALMRQYGVVAALVFFFVLIFYWRFFY